MAADPDTLADEATGAALDVLNALRREVLASIMSTREPFTATYKELLREIDALVVTFQRQLTGTMARHVDTAANAGDQQVLDDANAAGLETPLSYVGVSPTLVRTSAEYVATLVKGLSDEARNAITREIRLAALGGRSTTDLITRIGKNLDDPSVFKSLATRAEAIARTEVSRVRNTAFFEQSQELATRYPGVRKVWEHSHTSPGFSTHQRRMSRPNHIAAAVASAAKPLAMDELFDLGNETARYPHDPLLSAGNSVNCRCRLRLIAPDEDAPASTTTAPPVDDMPTFASADDARAWAAANLRSVFGDFGKAPMSVIAEAMRVARQFEQQTGKRIPAVIAFDSAKTGSRAYGRYRENERTIYLREVKSLRDLAERQLRDAEAWAARYPGVPWTTGQGIEGLLYHEAAHAIDSALRFGGQGIVNSARFDAAALSGQSAKNLAEAFAEAFTAVLLKTPTMSAIPRDIIEQILALVGGKA